MRMCRRLGLSPVQHGAVSTTIAVADTYRWLYASRSLGWKTVSALRSENGIGNGKTNYFGGQSSDRNSCYIPVPAIGSKSKSKKVKITATFYLPQAMTCCWAITSSTANQAVYQNFGAQTDANQYAAGTFAVPLGTTGTKVQEYTFEFPVVGIPKNTPFYLFLWGSASTGYAIHIQSDIVVTVEY